MSLDKVLKMYPPLHLFNQDCAESGATRTAQPLETKSEKIALPDWIIEPMIDEVRKIAVSG